MNTRFRQRAFSTLLLAMAALFVGEASYLVVAEAQVRAWMVPIHLGVGAPLALFVALLGSISLGVWCRQLEGEWPSERISAWMLSAGVVILAWAAATAKVVEAMTSRMATPSLAAAASALLSLLLLVFAAVAAGLLFPIFKGLLRRCAQQDWLKWLARPLTWLIAAVAAVAAAVVLGFSRAPEVFSVLPWAYVIGPAAALIAGVAALRLLPHETDVLARWNRRFVAAACVLSIFALFLPMRLEDARQSFVDRPALASLWKGVIHPYLDFDGDGSLFFYAGGDCAPFDAERGPHRTEIPNDGIDWNCSGSDLVVDLDDFHQGQMQVERPEGIVERPHVILITTDALSHPHTTVGGYERNITPHLAEWAERATVFETAFATSSSTRLALPGLLASKMNSQLHLLDGRVHPYDYHEDEVTLAVLLAEEGYRTVHIPGSAYFDTRWNGYWHGFEEVDNRTYRTAADRHHTSPELTRAAVDIVENHDDQRPLHLWIHYYDHHGPYIIPEGAQRFGDGESNRDRFDSEVHFADGNWRYLLEAIENRWEPEEYIVVFTSDHGEAFDVNHPRHHHGYTLHTSVLHVPFIIQAPWRRGDRIDGLTGHIDLVPTIANLLGLEPEEDWLGETLLPSLVDGASPSKSVIYSLFYIPEAVRRDEHRFQQIGVRTDEWYYYENNRRGDRRLVRWREDPLDRDDFSSREPDLFESYRYVARVMLEWLREREIGLTHTVDELATEF